MIGHADKVNMLLIRSYTHSTCIVSNNMSKWNIAVAATVPLKCNIALAHNFPQVNDYLIE